MNFLSFSTISSFSTFVSSLWDFRCVMYASFRLTVDVQPGTQQRNLMPKCLLWMCRSRSRGIQNSAPQFGRSHLKSLFKACTRLRCSLRRSFVLNVELQWSQVKRGSWWDFLCFFNPSSEPTAKPQTSQIMFLGPEWKIYNSEAL